MGRADARKAGLKQVYLGGFIRTGSLIRRPMNAADVNHRNKPKQSCLIPRGFRTSAYDEQPRFPVLLPQGSCATPLAGASTFGGVGIPLDWCAGRQSLWGHCTGWGGTSGEPFRRETTCRRRLEDVRSACSSCCVSHTDNPKLRNGASWSCDLITIVISPTALLTTAHPSHCRQWTTRPHPPPHPNTLPISRSTKRQVCARLRGNSGNGARRGRMSRWRSC